MAYYPKSQIKTNLYTVGEEFTTNPSDPSKSYSGFYWKTSQEEYFTGKTPQDLPIQKLFKISSLEKNTENNKNILYLPTVLSSNDNMVFNYIKLKNVDKNYFSNVPLYSPALPTKNDYSNGEFIRYFCKKTNEIFYLEINKETYEKLLNKDPQILFQLYIPFNIPWQIKGDKEKVYKINKDKTELISSKQKLPMLMEYLNFDFIKYLN